MPSYSRKVKLPGKTSQELYEKVSEGIDRFLGKVSIGKYEIERDPGQKELRVKGKIFSAVLKFQEAEIELTAQLSLLAAPFKSKLDEGITRWLAKTFDQSFHS